LRADKVMSY